MHDIKIIEADIEKFKNGLKNRKFDLAKIEELLLLNKERKSLIQEVENTQSEVKKISKEVGLKKRNGENADELMNKVHELKGNMLSKEKDLEETKQKLNFELSTIPNLLDEDTPIGNDDNDNIEIHKWGEPKKFSFQAKDHVDIGENLGMLDFESATKITGARFVVYRNKLARLERALANSMLDHQMDKGYEEIIPPFIVHERALHGTGQLPKFKDDLFKIEGEDWYLIPTSEVPLTNLKRDEIIDESELPIKYTGLTPCFRSEAGSHGKDTRGLIRMHQFNKVEMVNICLLYTSPSPRD